jgi:hypothetical protein
MQQGLISMVHILELGGHHFQPLRLLCQDTEAELAQFTQRELPKAILTRAKGDCATKCPTSTSLKMRGGFFILTIPSECRHWQRRVGGLKDQPRE